MHNCYGCFSSKKQVRPCHINNDFFVAIKELIIHLSKQVYFRMGAKREKKGWGKKAAGHSEQRRLISFPKPSTNSIAMVL